MELDEKTGCPENNKEKVKNKLLNLNDKVREFESKLIKSALVKSAGNQRKAAQILGIKSTTLHQKIKTHGIKLKLTTANFDK